jgi:hypothetical protein
MNRELLEGFETRDLIYWDGYQGQLGNISWHSGIPGMTSGYCIQLGFGNAIWRVLPAGARAERFWHFKVRPAFTVQAWCGILRIYSDNTLLIEIIRDWNNAINNWALRAKHGDGTDIGWGGTPFLQNVTYRVEVNHRVGSGSGVLEIRVDGNTVIYYAGNTTNAGKTTANKMQFNTLGAYDYPYFDDLVVDLDNWVGDASIYYRVPGGVGYSSEWTPFPPEVPHWSCINRTPVDQNAFLTTKDPAACLFPITSPPAYGEKICKAFQLGMIGTLTGNPAARHIYPLIRTNNQNVRGALKQLPMALNPTVQVWHNNPVTGAPITEQELTGLQIGMEAVA